MRTPADPPQASATLTRLLRSYVGLRNGECDVAAAAVELDPSRAACTASCPDTSVSPLPDLPGADYVLASYRDRLSTICCLEFGVSHMPASGFALLSKAHGSGASLVGAILSLDVLNAATPIIIAVIGFGWLMYLVEHRDNAQFHAQHSGVYFACVSLATFGFGDVAPVTRAGRLLTIFWCVMSVMSVSALTSVISARLTVDQLAYTTLDDLSQLRPSELCVESGYPAVEGFVSDTFALDGDLAGAGVVQGTVQDCIEAVMSGQSLAYLTDRPLLLWIAFEYLSTGSLYVSQTIHANPLTLAYSTGSTLRPLADAAVIRMTTDMAWYAARQKLESAWFPQGTTVLPGGGATQMNVPMLVAACVLVLIWLLGICETLLVKAWRAFHGGLALGRVSTSLRNNPAWQSYADGLARDAEAAGSGDDAAAAHEEGQQLPESTKAVDVIVARGRMARIEAIEF